MPEIFWSLVAVQQVLAMGEVPDDWLASLMNATHTITKCCLEVAGNHHFGGCGRRATTISPPQKENTC